MREKWMRRARATRAKNEQPNIIFCVHNSQHDARIHCECKYCRVEREGEGLRKNDEKFHAFAYRVDSLTLYIVSVLPDNKMQKTPQRERE